MRLNELKATFIGAESTFQFDGSKDQEKKVGNRFESTFPKLGQKRFPARHPLPAAVVSFSLTSIIDGNK